MAENEKTKPLKGVIQGTRIVKDSLEKPQELMSLLKDNPPSSTDNKDKK